MRPLNSLVFFPLLLISLPCWTDFTATVNSTEITESETLQLTLRWTGSDDRDSSAEPDVAPLQQDFEVLGIKRSKSSRFSTGPGMTQQSSFHYDWILTLRARRLGRITIPPIRYENLVSNAVVIIVSSLSSAPKPRKDRLAFLVSSVDREQVYVQSQLIYTVKFYYRNSYDGSLPTAPELEDALVKVLVDQKKYQSNVNGILYYVAEWRYAIFPQKSGELNLERKVHSGKIKIRDGGIFSRGVWENIQSVSEGHRIVVQPQPGSFPGSSWLPAKSLSLTESWTSNPPVFTVGEPINRTITVIAQGVPVSLLAPVVTEQMDNAKVYSDPAETMESLNEQGVIANRTETIGIVPTTEGRLDLPEIRIDWWNTGRERSEVVRIPAATYTVLPAPMGESIPFRPTIIEQPVQVPYGEPTPLSLSYWFYVAAALAIAWILTTTQWLRTRRNLYRVRQQYEKEPLSDRIDTRSEAELYKEFALACRGNDPITARARLLNWSKVHWPERNILRLPDLAAVDADDRLADAITDLDRYLFSRGSQQSWDGQRLLDLIDQLRSQRPNKSSKDRAVIPSLYPG